MITNVDKTTSGQLDVSNAKGILKIFCKKINNLANEKLNF